MAWWQLELVTAVVLVAIIVVLGPLIKRFGRAYAGDVFRQNPRTGTSYLVLMDFAYYLVFGAYVMFVVQFTKDPLWSATVGGAQLQATTLRIGGLLVLMGVLHGFNVLSLPVVGRLLGMGRTASLDQPPTQGSDFDLPHRPRPGSADA
ncbi:hypothetical protein [Salsipaludibacter albus]|uniref:hypothetical protein n=1 Tax=Salsipaludibacter albus TaxID=2849650 RepID=UPI001EE4B131|nr:hypothetical protein [Salsipaludibacter albus]MBY5162772.1 hypothetical protein [Salsipaludibacter albus]